VMRPAAPAAESELQVSANLEPRDEAAAMDTSLT